MLFGSINSLYSTNRRSLLHIYDNKGFFYLTLKYSQAWQKSEKMKRQCEIPLPSAQKERQEKCPVVGALSGVSVIVSLNGESEDTEC